MMTRYYRFAGVDIGISMPETLLYTDEQALGPFRITAAAAPHMFCFEMVEELDAPQGKLIASEPSFRVYIDRDAQVRYYGTYGESLRNGYSRVVNKGKHHQVQVKRQHYSQRIGVKTVLEALAAEHLIAQNDGFVFHCSYIDRDGKAILFTAPSETGKSTQAELWRELRGAEIINGDRAAVRLVDGVLMAEGIPFAGSSTYCKNRSLPVEAIVYLGQAPVTTIREMRGYEAFAKIWEGISVNTWDREDLERVSRVVQRLAERIPVFHMPCTPDESAVMALEGALRKLAEK